MHNRGRFVYICKVEKNLWREGVQRRPRISHHNAFNDNVTMFKIDAMDFTCNDDIAENCCRLHGALHDDSVNVI